MPTVISGILKDPIGKPIPNCTIELRALRTSTTVITKTIASQKFESNGSYSMNVESGRYGVTLSVEGYPPNYVGDITIDDKSEPGTLNDFLGALTDADLRPEAVKRFEAMAQRVAEQAAQVEKDKSAASGSAESASQSQAAAASSADDAATQAKAADGSAKSAAQSAQAAKVSEDNAEKSQTAALASAQQAGSNEAQAQQYASDALASKVGSEQSAKQAEESHLSAKSAAQEAARILENSLKKENNLAEISIAGDEAMAQARKNLELGAAAVMDVQEDIYDRTEGRLPLPGAFGYGAYFSSAARFSSANGPEEFLAWCKTQSPGRYLVYQKRSASDLIPIIEGVEFSGIVEIFIPATVTSDNQSKADRFVEFRGLNGEIYFNRLKWGAFVGWENRDPNQIPQFGAVGTYALMRWALDVASFPAGGFYPSGSSAGSNLDWANIPSPGGWQIGSEISAPVGTWRCLSRLNKYDQAGLFYRIA